MPERMSSFFILLGGTIAIIALWVISVMAVNWDTKRRMITELERKAWVAVAIVLPLFGFALYLSMRVLRRYLTPQQPEPRGNSPMTYVRPRQEPMAVPPSASKARRRPAEPLWDAADSGGAGGGAGSGANGGASSGASSDDSGTLSRPPNLRQTPATVAAGYQPAPAAYALVVMEGPHLGQQFILNHLPARIGRGPDAAVPLDADLNVSRRHAEIYTWNGSLRIRDLQSTHGTLVNGNLVTDQPIESGDRISTGGTVFILRETQRK